MKGAVLQSSLFALLAKSKAKTESRRTSDDCSTEEIKTDATTPRHQSDLPANEHSPSPREGLRSKERKLSGEVELDAELLAYRKKVFEGGCGSPVPPLQLSPPKILDVQLSPKIAPLVLNWEFKDFETLRSRYLHIAKVVCTLFYQLFNDRNELIEKVFVQFSHPTRIEGKWPI